MSESITLYTLITLSLATQTPQDSPFADEGIISFDGDLGMSIYGASSDYIEYTCGEEDCSRGNSTYSSVYYGPFSNENNDKYDLTRGIECVDNAHISVTYKVALCNGGKFTRAYFYYAQTSKNTFGGDSSTLEDDDISDICDEFDVHEVSFTSPVVYKANYRIPITIQIKLNEDSQRAFIYDVSYSCIAADNPTSPASGGAYTHQEYCVTIDTSTEQAEYFLGVTNSDGDLGTYNGNCYFKQDDVNGESYLFEDYQVIDGVHEVYKWVFATGLGSGSILASCSETNVSQSWLWDVVYPCEDAYAVGGPTGISYGECEDMHPRLNSDDTSYSPLYLNIADKTQMIALLSVFCLLSCVCGMLSLYAMQLLCFKCRRRMYAKVVIKGADGEDVDDIDF